MITDQLRKFNYFSDILINFLKLSLKNCSHISVTGLWLVDQTVISIFIVAFRSEWNELSIELYAINVKNSYKIVPFEVFSGRCRESMSGTSNPSNYNSISGYEWTWKRPNVGPNEVSMILIGPETEWLLELEKVRIVPNEVSMILIRRESEWFLSNKRLNDSRVQIILIGRKSNDSYQTNVWMSSWPPS